MLTLFPVNTKYVVKFSSEDNCRSRSSKHNPGQKQSLSFGNVNGLGSGGCKLTLLLRNRVTLRTQVALGAGSARRYKSITISN